MFFRRKIHVLSKGPRDPYELSEYEDEKGVSRFVTKHLGRGASADAWELGEDEQFVVLYPLGSDHPNLPEALRKLAFFRALYPHLSSDLLLLDQGRYRLVLSRVPGRPYRDLPAVSEDWEQIILFLSLVKAIKECHALGYVIIDLNCGNILLDDKAYQSKLIDGGMATRVGEKIPSEYSAKDDEQFAFAVKEMSEGIYTNAPECITMESLEDHRATAAFSMDIFALGWVIKKTIARPIEPLNQLITECMHVDSQERITLTALEHRLSDLLHECLMGRFEATDTVYSQAIFAKIQKLKDKEFCLRLLMPLALKESSGTASSLFLKSPASPLTTEDLSEIKASP